MNKILILVIFLSLSCLGAYQADCLSSKPIALPQATAFELDEKILAVLHKVSQGALYFGAGATLGSVSLVSGLAWGVCQISPWASTVGNECLLLSRVCGKTAQRAFAQIFAQMPSFFKRVPPSNFSWYLNQMLLSQIPASSKEDKELLRFLEKRWLAKSTGFYSSVINWVCPCFGIDIQVHPETTNSYARDPANKFSETYQNTANTWKSFLPHPEDFPLILTRPFDLRDYLPGYVDIAEDENIQEAVAKLVSKVGNANGKVVVDLTQLLPKDTSDRQTWLQTWMIYRDQLFSACEKHRLNPNQVFCIQRVQQKEIGGVRLLPLVESAKLNEEQHLFLLEWISKFGLSANRVELDRFALPSDDSLKQTNLCTIPIDLLPKEEFVVYLNSFEKNWKSDHPQTTFMLQGTLQVLQGLITAVPEEKWKEINNCQTRSSIVGLSFSRIRQQLELLAQEEETAPFFDKASHIEQVHSDLSSLLEICAPYTTSDFPVIYGDLLKCIPVSLKSLTSYAIHTSGMTSLTGIFKAVERSLGKPPRVLYGENTYFENIYAAEKVTNAFSIDEATEEDWKEVDLILAQFNPVLKRIDFDVTDYKAENIAGVLHQALNARQGKLLTLGLDCTLDYIDSPRVASLLAEFQDEIANGALNIICYRSGLKFDLFGMDNYCGAPFYMIHSQDPKWALFDILLTDPVLQIDRLSLNWFCLAYENAAPQLEHYRKQVFDNTRAFLNKVPTRLFRDNVGYRIIPVAQDVDPAFIDIKVFGSFHQFRSGLIGAFLSIKCMEKKYPVFYRPSLGFYHTNFSMLFGEECSTIRLTLGLDPTQVDLLVKCFETIDTLNGSLENVSY